MRGLASHATASPRRFRRDVFIVASVIAAAILVSVVAIPQWLSKEARWEVLRAHVGQIGQLAASTVDGDLHRLLLDPANYSPELYARALKPLVRFHSANSDLFYVYTMVDREHVPYFVLDTAGASDLRTKHQLRASAYMQPFRLRKEYRDDWLNQIAAGKTYVTPRYEHDDYGNFLTAHAPIYDSEGRYSGFVGVDFDMRYYLAEEARFRVIEFGSLVIAGMVALLIGFLVALYYGDLQRRIRELYYRATRDDLTGLLNRRGAKDAVTTAIARQAAGYVMMIVDIDYVKMIISMHGHSTGDAVIAYTADAIRQSVGDEAICARLGAGEFMILFTGCDVDAAKEAAERMRAKLSRHQMVLTGVKFTVSLGIAAHKGITTSFSQMYADADAALYQARVEGENGMGMFKLWSNTEQNGATSGASSAIP